MFLRPSSPSLASAAGYPSFFPAFFLGSGAKPLNVRLRVWSSGSRTLGCLEVTGLDKGRPHSYNAPWCLVEISDLSELRAA